MSPAHSERHVTRDSIMAELAAVLRNADASTTSIESAIAKSDVSADEVAAHFDSRRELVLAMVSQLTDELSAPLRESASRSNMRTRLIDFGERVAEGYATSHLRALYRIAITESIRHTGLGRDFYEIGPGRLLEHVASFLKMGQNEGVVRSGAPHLLASHLLALLRTHLDDPDACPNELAVASNRASYARDAVDLFCRGIHAGKQPC
jgi:AcrR family transcriptional regulator